MAPSRILDVREILRVVIQLLTALWTGLDWLGLGAAGQRNICLYDMELGPGPASPQQKPC
jgi:hypothetical protein